MLISGRAFAHPAPAAAPTFEPAPCVTVVDAAASSPLPIAYRVDYDDRDFMDGDIRLPDAKTHQFFAVRGAIAWDEGIATLVPFEPSDDTRIPMPHWISLADVERSIAAVAGSGTMLSASDVPTADVLETNPLLSDRLLRIDQDSARRPITIEASLFGATWDLASAPPGLYTIAGYIFSPPFNGWADKPGLINIVADANDPAQRSPAAALSSIAGVLRTFQGRRVSGCASGPPGTTVRGEALSLSHPELGWTQWLAEGPLDAQLTPNTDQLQACFRSPFIDLSGAMRVRLVLSAPSGAQIAAYSIDTLTALVGDGLCLEDEHVCCPEPADLEPITDASADPGASPTTNGCTIASPSTPAGAPDKPWLAILLGASLALARRRSLFYARSKVWRRMRSSSPFRKETKPRRVGEDSRHVRSVLPARQRGPEYVADTLARQILSGALKPGEALATQRELAERFDLSMLVIRQAIHRLEDLGLVRVRQGSPTIVLDPELATDLRMLQLRMELAPMDEGLAMSARESQLLSLLPMLVLAERRITPDQIAVLRYLIDRVPSNPSRHEVRVFQIEWLRQLAKATRNAMIQQQLRWWVSLFAAQQRRSEESVTPSSPLVVAFYSKLTDSLATGSGTVQFFLSTIEPLLQGFDQQRIAKGQ